MSIMSYILTIKSQDEAVMDYFFQSEAFLQSEAEAVMELACKLSHISE